VALLDYRRLVGAGHIEAACRPDVEDGAAGLIAGHLGPVTRVGGDGQRYPPEERRVTAGVVHLVLGAVLDDRGVADLLLVDCPRAPEGEHAAAWARPVVHASEVHAVAGLGIADAPLGMPTA